MTSEEQAIFDAWQRNARVNASLIGHLNPDLMRLRDPGGGWSIAQHLAHLHGFRKGWLSYLSPRHVQHIDYLFTGDPDEDFEATTEDPAVFLEAFRVADAAAEQAVRDALAAGGSFGREEYRDPRSYLQHAIVHDAHHRAQVLMVLRLAGHRWEGADRPMWAPWRE